MPKFKRSDRVCYTTCRDFGIGTVEYVCVPTYLTKQQNYIVVFREDGEGTFELMIEESKLILSNRVRHICPECGIDYADEDMADHMRLEHGQAEAELMEMDRKQGLKADQYDRICNMMFMATGIVDDGDSIKYIVDPETVCNELLRIIIEDENVNREKLVDAKEKRFKEITLW